MTDRPKSRNATPHRRLSGLLLASLLALGATQAMAEDYPRRAPISLPADAKAIFMAQMLGHIVSLDAIVAALGRGDYAAAAEVAESEIAVPRFQAQEGGQDQGPGLGIAEHLPEAFRENGRRFRAAAGRFAEVARAIPAQPDAAQVQQVNAALGGITKECRVCHDAYRIE